MCGRLSHLSVLLHVWSLLSVCSRGTQKTEMRDSERDRFSYNAYYNILSNVYDKIAFKVYYKILSSVYYKVLSDALYVFYKTTATLNKKCRSNK